MRYVKIVLVLAAALAVLLELFYNYAALSTPVSLQLKLPGLLLAAATWPVWLLLTLVFVGGFLLALVFEVYYWYQYSRTIRAQKKLISALQKQLEQAGAASPAKKTPTPAGPER